MNHPCDQIRKIRTQLGISQAYIADKLEISQTAYSKIENQQTKIKYDTIFEISQILNVPLIELVDSKNERLNNNEFKLNESEKIINELEKIINYQVQLIDYVIKKDSHF